MLIMARTTEECIFTVRGKKKKKKNGISRDEHICWNSVVQQAEMPSYCYVASLEGVGSSLFAIAPGGLESCSKGHILNYKSLAIKVYLYLFWGNVVCVELGDD